ncbi:MAG: hypothetical protein MAG431_01959 [Chloroflexi bacterium]|nr:hypothetical protein [Chloroflexota bacterium]
MAEKEISELYSNLVQTEFDFIPRGTHSLPVVYDIVKENYQELCDNDFLCLDTCKSGNNSPEWQHAVRRALNELKRKKYNGVENSRRGYWIFVGNQFSPLAVDFKEKVADTQRVLTESYRIIRDTKITRKLKAKYQNSCQICEETIPLPNNQDYSEAHQIQPLGSPHNGPDISSNILVLCPNHHAMCDYGSILLDIAMLFTHPEHKIGQQYIEYHNKIVAPNPVSIGWG